MPGDGGEPRYKAEELIGLYEREGLRLFSGSVGHRLDSLEGISEERYPSEGVEEVLAEYFGEVRLREALVRLLITSYEIQLRIPFFFRSERAKASPDYDFPMRQVARATSAAPTYFEPAKVEAEGPVDYYALVDGGVFANNPAMCAYVEARRILEAQDAPATDVLVVSLGTGQLTDRLRYEEAAGWGLLGWARPIIDVVFDGVSDTVDFQLKELLSPLKDRKRRYYRFQRELVEVSDAMDNASPQNLRDLKLLAAAMIHDEGEKLSELCERLTQIASP